MTDMELVIKIDEKLYSDMKSLPFTTFTEDVIINGTPLPKGHGRLIDAAERMDISCIVDHAPTIIDADVAESEDKE